MSGDTSLSEKTTGRLSFNELLAKDHEKRGRLCDLGEAFERMDSDLSVEVKEAMADRKYSAASISRTLTRLGYDVSEGAVRRCRRSCECWR